MKRTVKRIVAAVLSITCVLCAFCLSGCKNNDKDGKVEMQQRMSVNKTAGSDFKILQITDTQIIDPEQVAYPSRLTPADKQRWADREENCMKYVRELIESTNPNFIVLTGDNVYGSFDNDGSNFTALVNLIDGYGIPWSLVFGNHDGETYDLTDPQGAAHPWGKGYDWQIDYLLNHTENCLFDVGAENMDNSRHGNYAVDIKQDGKTVYALFMMDSHDGVTEQFGLTRAQVDWYASQVEQISYERNGKKSLDGGVVPSVIFQHIPTYQHYLAALEYTQTGKGIISKGADVLDNGDWGQLLDGVTYNSAAYRNYSDYLWQKVQQYGSTKAICVGHYHTNAMRINYKGENDAHAVQLVFGVKTGTFDYYYQLGGTLITVKDGSDVPQILPVYLQGSQNL